MNRTKIEWVRNPDGNQGFTWNPLTGCLNHVNGMCKGGDFPCYAYRLAHGRLKSRYLVNENIAPLDESNLNPDIPLAQMVFRADKALADPFYPRFWPEKLDQPLNRKKPAGIFTCDMSDLFGIGVPEQWTWSVFNFIEKCPQHRFYLLTKQPQNLIKFSPFPDNCWVGVTATNHIMFNKAAGNLAQIDAKVKFISFEPLLESAEKLIAGASYLSMLFKEGWLNWVIIGAQTKPYKPPQIEGVEEIVRAADRAGVKVFLKENLAPPFRYPEHQWAYGKHPNGVYTGGLRQEMPG